MISQSPTCTIIDIGTLNTRIGQVPMTTTTTTTTTTTNCFESDHCKPTIISSTFQTTNKQGRTVSSCPIEQGTVSDWKLWEQFLQQTITTANCCSDADTSPAPLFLIESPLSSNTMRERSAQIAFENLSVPQLFIENTAVTSLFSSHGSTTGVVVDSGYGDTTIVPVYDGFALTRSAFKIELAAMSIDNLLMQLLKKKENNQSINHQTVVDIKEKYARVASDYEQEVNNCLVDSIIEYTLPDDTKIQIGSERLNCCEILFHPQIATKEYAKLLGGMEADNVEVDKFNGLAVEVWKSIIQSDSSIREELYENIVLVGGNTLFPGLQDRLLKELKTLAPDYVDVNVIANSNRKDAAWIGAAMMATKNDLPWITKQQYEEQGASVVHKEDVF